MRQGHLQNGTDPNTDKPKQIGPWDNSYKLIPKEMAKPNKQ